MILAAIGCIGQGVAGIAGNEQTEPQVISCAKLGAEGPGDNGHVTVTDFRACTDLVVVQGGDGKTYWNEAFVPLIPARDPDTKNFHVLLDSLTLDDGKKLAGLNSTSSVTGTINRIAQGPTEEAKALLANAYPGVNLNTCYVVHHNVVAISKSRAVVLFVASAVLIAGAVLIAKKMPSQPASGSTPGPVSGRYSG